MFVLFTLPHFVLFMVPDIRTEFRPLVIGTAHCDPELRRLLEVD